MQNDGENNHASESGLQSAGLQGGLVPIRKKKKSKGTKARGPGALPKSRGSGFEEYYCDPPVTPAEYGEERELYAPDRPFHDRIEICIQRFRARRRLNNNKSTFFTYYLLLGGIDSTPRQFQGTRSLETDDTTSRDHVEAMQANDVILRGMSTDARFYNPHEADKWEVDWTGVVSGFLGEWLPKHVGGADPLILEGIDVVANFLKYVTVHDVCPEYSADLQSALAVCDKAKTELLSITKAAALLPGAFNTAASVLFDADQGADSNPYTYELQNTPAVSLDRNAATLIFYTTLLCWLGDTPRMEAIRNAKNVFVARQADLDLEVVEIPAEEYPDHAKHRGSLVPTNAQLRQYLSIKTPPRRHDAATWTAADPADVKTEEAKPLTPCSVIRLRPTLVVQGWDRGGPESQTPVPAWFSRAHEDFFLETDIIRHLAPGMKLRAAVAELSSGVKFLRAIREVFPTFYTFLPQQLMLKYKHPALSERPGPSVDDPEAGADEGAEADA